MASSANTGFEHDVFFYGDLSAYVEHVGEYVTEGIDADQTVLVATTAVQADALRDHLGTERVDAVRFVDMGRVGRNPGRLIPMWREFIADATGAGRGARAVAEPMWEGRGADEITECQYVETLVNLAFDEGPAWSLLCPYDVATLSEEVLQEAMRSHPSVVVNDLRRASNRYLDPSRVTEQLATPLPDPAVPVTQLVFGGDDLVGLRGQVAARARLAAVDEERVEDLTLVVHELATNSVRHGGGGGLARWWDSGTTFVVEVSDAGHIADPLAGRTRPAQGSQSGRGLWLVHQLSDLVELRSSPAGTVVRVSMVTEC